MVEPKIHTARLIMTNIQTIKDIISPPSDNWLGHLNTLKGLQAHSRLSAWSDQYDGFYRIRLAHKQALVIGKPDLVQRILEQRPDHFRRRSDIETIFKELGLNGLFSMEGETWKKQRPLFNPAFNGANLRYFFPIMSQITDRLIDKVRNMARSEQVVDIKALLTLYATDLISSLTFGYDLNSLQGQNTELHQHLAAVFPGIYARLTSPIPLWRVYKTQQDRQFEQSVAAIKGFLKERVANTRQQLADNPTLAEAPENLLQAIIAEQNKHPDLLTDEDILANALTILIAGEETTATSLAWLSHLLTTHCDIQQQLHSEMAKLSEQDLKHWPLPRTPLLTACIHESMRLKPVAPILFIEPKEDTQLENTAIPAGTPLILLLSSFNQDQARFKDSRCFNPHRWLEDDACKVKDMIPFGAGARRCPGRSLALLEMKLGMSRLLKAFELEGIDSHKVEEQFIFTVMPEHLSVRFKERTFSHEELGSIDDSAPPT